MTTTTKKLKLREGPVTQETFDRLPALLTAYQVKLMTGLDDHDLAEEVRAKRLEVWRRPVRTGRQRSYAKYTKASVGRMVGLSC